MRKKIANVFIGALLICLAGVLVYKGCNPGVSFPWLENWWALFLLIPGIYSMINGGINVGNTILTLLGAYFFVCEYDWFDKFDNINLFYILVAALLVLIGLRIIFGRRHQPYIKNQNDNAPIEGSVNGQSYQNVQPDRHARVESANTKPNYFSIFSGQDVFNNTQGVQSVTATAILGGMDIDFRACTFVDGARIELVSIMGGVDIKLPSDVNAIVTGIPILGGFDNKFVGNQNQGATRVYINYTSIMGGNGIK